MGNKRLVPLTDLVEKNDTKRIFSLPIFLYLVKNRRNA